MEEHALATRRFYSDHPPRAEYALTDKGVSSGWWRALAAWGSRHVHRQTALVHAECGHPVEIKYFCRQCAGRVRAPPSSSGVGAGPNGETALGLADPVGESAQHGAGLADDRGDDSPAPGRSRRARRSAGHHR